MESTKKIISELAPAATAGLFLMLGLGCHSGNQTTRVTSAAREADLASRERAASQSMNPEKSEAASRDAKQSWQGNYHSGDVRIALTLTPDSRCMARSDWTCFCTFDTVWGTITETQGGLRIVFDKPVTAYNSRQVDYRMEGTGTNRILRDQFGNRFTLVSLPMKSHLGDVAEALYPK